MIEPRFIRQRQLEGFGCRIAIVKARWSVGIADAGGWADEDRLGQAQSLRLGGPFQGNLVLGVEPGI